MTRDLWGNLNNWVKGITEEVDGNQREYLDMIGLEYFNRNRQKVNPMVPIRQGPINVYLLRRGREMMELQQDRSTNQIMLQYFDFKTENINRSLKYI